MTQSNDFSLFSAALLPCWGFVFWLWGAQSSTPIYLTSEAMKQKQFGSREIEHKARAAPCCSTEAIPCSNMQRVRVCLVLQILQGARIWILCSLTAAFGGQNQWANTHCCHLFIVWYLECSCQPWSIWIKKKKNLWFFYSFCPHPAESAAVRSKDVQPTRNLNILFNISVHMSLGLPLHVCSCSPRVCVGVSV